MKNFWKRAVCLAMTLALFTGLAPLLEVGAAAAETLEERQQAAVAAAMAYLDKGHSVQYGGETLVPGIDRGDGGKTRSTNQTTPEGATPQETMYTVCSDFAHQVYWEAFHYQLKGDAGSCWTGGLVRTKPGEDPMTVWYWETGDASKMDSEDAMTEVVKVAQPGDVLTTAHSGGGHTMVCVGDVLGDGVKYFAHSWGADSRKALPKGFADTREYGPDADNVDTRYSVSKNTDSHGGSIRLSTAAWVRKNYRGEATIKVNLVRPALVLTDAEYPITAATKYRLSHPRLAIDRYLNKTRFNSLLEGETVTMTLTLTNFSKQDYTVPVTEKAPVSGAKLKTPVAEAQVSGDTQKWDVELKAGETKTFTCEYEITAKQYETVTFDGGSVGDIPSNSMTFHVGGKKLTAEDTAKLAAIAKGEYNDKLAAAGASSNDLGDVVYQQILGLNVRLPQHNYVMNNLIKYATTRRGTQMRQFKTPADASEDERTAARMLVPTAWGGKDIWYEWGTERMNDPRDKHLEPGDVIVHATSILKAAQPLQLVYLGDGKYLSYDSAKNEYPIVEEPQFVYCLQDRVFYVLRPTLAYEDVHKLPALPAETNVMKFEDVKGRDWFYTYVRELVADGTVNGMTETTFEPNGTLTYGQALKLVTLAVGEKEPAKTGDHWASGYLALAKEKKWLDGDVDPDVAITRQALCQILAKAKGLKTQPKTNPFTDTQDKDVLALYKAGVINGMTAKTFEPEGKLTRAQISKIICALREVKTAQPQKTEEAGADD